MVWSMSPSWATARGFVFSPMPEYNYVDKHINAKLEKAKILPSDECTDDEFVRRVYLDLTGIIPTRKTAQAFVEDPRPPGKAAISWSAAC